MWSAALQDDRREKPVGHSATGWAQLSFHGDMRCVFGRGRGSLRTSPSPHSKKHHHDIMI